MTEERNAGSVATPAKQEPRFDVSFALAGGPVPQDHGYALFGALAHALREDLHGARWLAVHPILGVPRPDKTLALTRTRGALRIRVDGQHIAPIVSLAGQTLRLDGVELLLGTSQVFPLRPARTLAARLVTIKGFLEPEPFREALKRQLDALHVEGRVEVGRRRTLRVATDTVVGYQVTLHDLGDESSLILQHAGLGGRQRMGCGIFVPLGKR